MAALPYIQLYVADYLADTMHLTTEEHGAYLLLIFNYWQTGKPIPKKRLRKVARLSNERWTAVEDSLNEYFNDNGTEWEHERIERDLKMVHCTQAQRSAAGRASAEARRQKKATEAQRETNGRSTPVEMPLNENPTNKDTETDTETDKTEKTRKSSLSRALNFESWPQEPKPEQWAEILGFRKGKKQKNTQRAYNLLGGQLHKAMGEGYSFQQCMDMWELKQWGAFEAAWMENAVRSYSQAKAPAASRAQQIEDANAAVLRSFGVGETIEGEVTHERR